MIVTSFDLTEYNIFLMNLECCFATYSEALEDVLELGKRDKLECLSRKTKLLGILIKRLNCVDDPNNDPCLSIDNIEHFIMLGKQLCKCNCCDDDTYVSWNSVNGFFTNLTPKPILA